METSRAETSRAEAVEVELEAKLDAADVSADAGAASGEVGGEGKKDPSEGEGEFVKIRLVTWNVGNAKPDFAELAHTLPIKELRDTDLVVIGTQENHFKGESAGISKKTSTANILNDIV